MRKIKVLTLLLLVCLCGHAQYADKSKDETITGEWKYKSELQFTDDKLGLRRVMPNDSWVKSFDDGIYVRDIHRSFKYGGTINNPTATPTNSYIYSHEWGDSYKWNHGAQTIRIKGTTADGIWQWAIKNGDYNSSAEIISINNQDGGRVGILNSNPSYVLDVNGDVHVNNGWLRVKGSKGLYFQDYGGGFYMQDNTWIRTWGNKSFYHNSGIMRTDGTFQVGSGGNRFIVNSSGNVGIGTTSPGSKLNVGTKTTNTPSSVAQLGLSKASGEARVLSLVNSGGGSNQSTSLEFHNRNNWSATGKIQLQQIGGDTKAKMNFYTYNGGLKKRMTLNENGNLHIGAQVAPPGTTGEINRLSLQPYGHTGGKWNFVARDKGAFAFMDIRYGNGANLSIRHDGNIGIGTRDPQEKLSVNGTILAKEVKVSTDASDWPDFVFEEDYDLKDLSEVESFILTNKHLPEIPSAAQMEEQGVNLAEMNKLLLQKVEELTLYQIAKNKEIQELKEARKKEQGERKKETEERKKLEKALSQEQSARSEMEARLARLEALLLGTNTRP